MRQALLAALVGALILVAGCASKEDPATPTPETQNNVTTTAATNGNATTNATANATAAPPGKDPNMPDDPSACMGGMDMPGCTAAQSAYYYKKQQENYVAPPPDKPLAPVKITLTPQGPDASGKFSIENGTMILLVSLYVNDTGTGPYLAMGANPGDDLKLEIKGPTTKTFTIKAAEGVDPVAALSTQTNSEISMPAQGDYTVTLTGMGQNVVVTMTLTERFYM